MSSRTRREQYFYIIRCMKWLINNIVPEYINKTLSPELEEKIDKFYSSVRNSIDWYNLTKEDCISLGCIRYEDNSLEEEYCTWYFPAWVYPIIPEGLSVVDKNGNILSFNKKDIPFKVFYGNLDIGIRFSNSTYAKSFEELIDDLKTD